MTRLKIAEQEGDEERQIADRLLRLERRALVVPSSGGGGTGPGGLIRNADIAADAAILLSKLAQNPLDRSLHSGTQLASTISDLTSATQGVVSESFIRSRIADLLGPLAVNNQQITLVADPTGEQHAVNKRYVDGLIQGLKSKAIAYISTTTNINISSPGNTFDGFSFSNDDAPVRVLVKNQTNQTQNGIYNWNGATSPMTRSLDADTSGELSNAYLFVANGDTYADTGWLADDVLGSLGSANVRWVQFSTAGQISTGSGLAKNGNIISIASLGVTSGMIAAGAVGPGKLSQTFWFGLTGRAAGLRYSGANSSPAVDVDGVTLEIDNSDTSGTFTDPNGNSGLRAPVRVKDNGLSQNKLTNGTLFLDGPKLADVALPVSRGGTGAQEAQEARVNLGIETAGASRKFATGYSVDVHPAGSSFTIGAGAHNTGIGMGKILQVFNKATGDEVMCDKRVSSSGDVTFTFSQSQASNTLRFNVIGF